jgi:hypothetical protein
MQAIKSLGGHKDVETTLGYVKMAEDLGGKVGAPFPPLPARLLKSPPKAPGRFDAHDLAGKLAVLSAGGGNRTPDLARMKRPL